MVMIIEGKSLCCLCKQVLDKDKKYIGYPAFLPFDHKYGRFSDASFHKECFYSDPDHTAVDDMYTAYKMIRDSAPKDLKSMADIYAWEKEAYKDWPPKNGVVIFEPLVEDSEEGAFFMDVDSYREMCEMEEKHKEEREERKTESRRLEREMMRYDRDDD